MTMTLVTKGELEKLALEEMRRNFYCGALDRVAVRTDPYGVWFIAPNDPTAAFSEGLKLAAENAQIRLRLKYDLQKE